MIVAIDGTPSLRSQPTGTEVYARQIIESLAETNSRHTIRVYGNAAAPPSWLPAQVDWRGIPFKRLWTHWRFGRTLRREAPDVIFVPSHVLPVGLRLPAVVTIHDVGHRRERGSYGPASWLYLELMTRYMARHATRLIAVSQSTADDLRRFYAVPAVRIKVIHSGIDDQLRPPPGDAVTSARQKYALGDAYYLYVGRNHPRKNLPMLLRAFHDARAHGLRASLVLAGPGHSARGGDGVHVLSYVPVEDLPALYAGALALTLPSRFEGFGFPALEAMRCGTVVIASNAGALPEVVGPAGILLSPDDPSGWSATLQRLAGDAAERRRLIAAGQAWSTRFTWRGAAEQVWTVLEEAAREGYPTASR